MSSAKQFVEVEGTLNVRSLQWLLDPEGHGTSTKVFRSGNLARITPKGKQQLRELGVKRVFDMRSKAEQQMEPTSLADDPDFEYSHAAIFDWYAADEFTKFFEALQRDTPAVS